MNELFSPFRSKETLIQMGLCALVFIGMAVPFKVMVLIEGFTEVRPVNAVPVVAGLLLGPAGAWGCAIGNLIADLFGTFSKASILGFLGNFMAAYLPYKLWHISGKRETPNVKNYKNILKYILISAITALATALIIACGLDVLFGIWMTNIFWIIVLNDLGFPLLIGLPIFIVLTSEDSHFKITVPIRGLRQDRGKGYSYLKYSLLGALILSELALLGMIVLGMQMSGSPLMAVMGSIFTIALFGFVVRSE
jgi:energy-coupling factor transport system substrate-specific component